MVLGFETDITWNTEMYVSKIEREFISCAKQFVASCWIDATVDYVKQLELRVLGGRNSWNESSQSEKRCRIEYTSAHKHM